MSITDITEHRAAQDGYDAFYAEKIWGLIPGIYRGEDRDGSLRGLVEVLAGEAAEQRRSIDRLWADASIVDCDDWVIPYIAEMLGTRLISEQNVAGRRADVANTIKYRRIAGTVQLLVMLADDIAGWDAVASEAFKRLIRNWHSLDCPPVIGPVSGTPQHGLARLSRFRVGEVVDTGFDDVAHFPDFRRLRGVSGRYNIPKVNLHLYRQQAFQLRRTTPFDFGEGRFALDPSGRDAPLFQPGQPMVDGCRSGAEWEVRKPMPCALFNDGRYQITPDVAGVAVGSDLLRYADMVFRDATTFLDRAARAKGADLTPDEAGDLMAAALLPDSNRAHLFGDAIHLGDGPDAGSDGFGVGALFGADLTLWNDGDATPDWIEALVDPATGRVRTDGPLTAFKYYEGRFAPVGAGTHDRQADLTAEDPAVLPVGGATANFEFPVSGAHQMNDSRTYQHRHNTGLTVEGDLHVQAANGERPFIRISATAGGGGTPRFVIDADADGRDIILDGVWLGMIIGTDPLAQSESETLCEIVLAGDFNRVCLRNMTIDPGGAQASLLDPAAPPDAPELITRFLPTVRLLIEGASDLIEIDRCVVGPIEEAEGAQSQCAGGTLRITDSIIRAGQTIDGVTLPAFRGRHSTLEITRSTIIGNIEAARYFITDSIVQGTVSAQDPQGSCIRYSAAAQTDEIALANAYECEVFADVLPTHIFVSRRFGDPGLVQLSQTAPGTIRRGAENTSEMGVYNRTLDAIKRDDLTYKLSEFTAINTITQLIFET
ncbi:MAG: hypothetical protein ACSHXB_14845 [Sulfitobacter sp.]